MQPLIAPRNTAKLSTSLHRDLSIYTLAAAAAGVSATALASPAAAEIVYTQAHQSVGRGQSYAIDLNHDGLTDFTLNNIVHINVFQGHPYSSSFRLQVVPSEVAGVQAGSVSSLAPALPPQALIGSRQPARYRAEILVQQWQLFDTYYHIGSWVNVENRYLGFHFKIDGAWHYGWARMTVRSNEKRRLVGVLTGYAYETVANKPILAGDIGNESASGANSPQKFGATGGSSGRAATLGDLALGSAASHQRDLNQ